MCESQYQSFKEIQDTEDISEYLSTSYLSSLSVNMDAQIRADYDSCINKEVTEDPNTWATNFVSSHEMLQLWTNDQKMLAASDAAVKITEECSLAETVCDGCLAGLNSVYTAYSLYLDETYDVIESDYWKMMQKSLMKVSLWLINFKNEK